MIRSRYRFIIYVVILTIALKVITVVKQATFVYTTVGDQNFSENRTDAIHHHAHHDHHNKRDTTSLPICYTDAPACFDSLFAYTGHKPKLLSFRRRNARIHTKHRVSGEALIVPNIVHLIRFGANYTFHFPAYVTLKSIDKFIRPHSILVWGDGIPRGKWPWWQRALGEVPNIYAVRVPRITRISNKVVKFPAHESDYLRLQILLKYGGIYLDNDVIAVRSFDDVRVHSFAAGMEGNHSVSNGVLVAAPGAKFAKLWLESYGTYHNESWSINSVANGFSLLKLFGHLIHIEKTGFVHPTWKAGHQMFGKYFYNYTNNYSVHIYDHFKANFIPKNEKQLRGYNCTLGKVMRFVLYGKDDLLDTKNVTYGKHRYNSFNTRGLGIY